MADSPVPITATADTLADALTAYVHASLGSPSDWPGFDADGAIKLVLEHGVRAETPADTMMRCARDLAIIFAARPPLRTAFRQRMFEEVSPGAARAWLYDSPAADDNLTCVEPVAGPEVSNIRALVLAYPQRLPNTLDATKVARLLAQLQRILSDNEGVLEEVERSLAQLLPPAEQAEFTGAVRSFVEAGA